MYKLNKVKSEFENCWKLKINGRTVGHAEVVFLADTYRTVKGKISVDTVDGDTILFEYDGSQIKKPYSVANFMNDAAAHIGDVELKLIPDSDEYTDDGRLYDNIVLTSDVNEGNVNELAKHLKVYNLQGNTPAKRVQALRNKLLDNAEKAARIPFYDLVQKAKMGASRSTPLKDLY